LCFSIKIRENPQIKGIKVLHSEHEISQFADDTSVILDGSEESLNETLLELEWFKKISGLKIIFSKTQVIWIGSKKYSSDRLCENWNLSWGKTTFTVLGINFDDVSFPQERFQFSHNLSLLSFLLPIQITCVFEKIILRPDIFLNHSNPKSVSSNDSSDPSKITDVSSAN
jgi:hypothetical protein